MMQVQLHLAPFDADVHQQVLALHEHYGKTLPPFPEEALIVKASRPGQTPEILIASMYLFEARPFLMAEFGIVNPMAPMRVRHEASELILRSFMARAAMKGLCPITHTPSKGIQSMLRRYGWHNTGRPMWIAVVPSVPLTGSIPVPVKNPPSLDAQEGGLGVTRKNAAEEPTNKKRVAKRKARRKQSKKAQP